MEIKKKKSKKRLIIIGIIGVLIIAVAVIIMRGRAARRAAAAVRPQETLVLGKSDMTHSLSVSGVVESGRVTNVYSTLSYPVREVHAKVGDKVKAGDILAVLDTTNLENDIAQAELNYENVLISASEEQRSLKNSITNAQMQLDSSQITLERQKVNLARAENDLKEAMKDIEEPFDSYRHDLTISDALTALERRGEDLQKAIDDYNKALNDFDDYSYRHSINEAKIALDRRKADVATAEKDLADEKAGRRSSDSNVTTIWDNLVKARADVNTKTAARDAAQAAYDAIPAEDTEEKANALKVLNDAKAALTLAINTERTLEDNYYSASDSYSVQRDAAIRSAERALESAKRARDDAQRVFDKANKDLERAQKDAVDSFERAMEKAQNTYADAQKQYENALKDKQRALDDYVKNNDTKLTNIKKTIEDSKNQLRSAENSVASARNSLEQAASRPATSDISVRGQELNLEKLNKNLANGTIVATVDGVITESNIKVGASPSGILFVIEQTDDLYVSARVREYNLSSVSVGLDTEISTDATGSRIYKGVITYISPKAVSAAGSTSVEFEVKSKLFAQDDIIRIGMNAFLNIIMDTRVDVYSVPASILVVREDGEYVVELSNGVRNEIKVTTGLRTSTNTEISSPELYDGMRLLVDPEGKLSVSSTSRPFWMR